MMKFWLYASWAASSANLSALIDLRRLPHWPTVIATMISWLAPDAIENGRVLRKKRRSGGLLSIRFPAEGSSGSPATMYLVIFPNGSMMGLGLPVVGPGPLSVRYPRMWL